MAILRPAILAMHVGRYAGARTGVPQALCPSVSLLVPPCPATLRTRRVPHPVGMGPCCLSVLKVAESKMLLSLQHVLGC